MKKGNGQLLHGAVRFLFLIYMRYQQYPAFPFCMNITYACRFSFNALAEKVATLRRRSDGGRMERWLTGEEVCGQLRISPRTLQTLRDRRLIGYSQINRRFYYKPEEVKRLIPLVGTLYPGGK